VRSCHLSHSYLSFPTKKNLIGLYFLFRSTGMRLKVGKLCRRRLTALKTSVCTPHIASIRENSPLRGLEEGLSKITTRCGGGRQLIVFVGTLRNCIFMGHKAHCPITIDLSALLMTSKDQTNPLKITRFLCVYMATTPPLCCLPVTSIVT